jgi:hypothetical protein
MDPFLDDRLILLTAAVTPAQTFNGVLTDPAVRLQQYHLALKFWCEVAHRTGARVLIVETSGADPSCFRQPLSAAERRRVSVLSHSPSLDVIERGIGAIEAEAIDAAMLTMAHSPSDGTLVTKVTGRLRVRNAVELSRSSDRSMFLVRRTLDRQYADSRYFQVSVALWISCMAGLADQVSDSEGRYLEHALAHRLVVAEYEDKLGVGHFARRPLVEGASGTTGRKYGNGLKRAFNGPVSWGERAVLTLASKQV